MDASHLQMQKKQIRELCCCPTLCLAIGGPWLCVLGLVLTKNVIIQRLTSMEWLADSTTDDSTRVLKVAGILWALRKTLEKLKKFYQDLADPLLPHIKLTDSHPRFYPFPTSFPMKGQTITFAYLHPLESHATCVAFKVKIRTDCKDLPFKKGSILVVKFASKYGTNVHHFLADRKFAPALYYIGKVPEWEPAIKAGQPLVNLKTQSVTFGVSLMVVMAFMKPSKKPPAEELKAQQVANILYLLHSSGFVFGDLRPPNILFDGQHINLIDFDWTGYFNPRDAEIDDNSEGVPLLVQEKIKSLRPRTEIAQFPYNVLSKLFGEERLRLKPILPRHDWKMWRTHFPLAREQEDMILQNLRL